MHDAYVNSQRDIIYLVMDHVEGCTLKNYIRLFKKKHKEDKISTAGGLPES